MTTLDIARRLAALDPYGQLTAEAHDPFRLAQARALVCRFPNDHTSRLARARRLVAVARLLALLDRPTGAPQHTFGGPPGGDAV